MPGSMHSGQQCLASNLPWRPYGQCGAFNAIMKQVLLRTPFTLRSCNGLHMCTRTSLRISLLLVRQFDHNSRDVIHMHAWPFRMTIIMAHVHGELSGREHDHCP
uniref:Uncharacterized protein n=1 Tax=Haptolina brevifila TaxID=156173 RepID=A0A7S2GXI4_9EUKA|mmetsp:Transcript_48711/g.97182  ORF Transcript_48711/g.97182 Transcript_48711/m.97182 type:complete len:104 (+) Transcript_48711:108-419(+)